MEPRIHKPKCNNLLNTNVSVIFIENAVYFPLINTNLLSQLGQHSSVQMKIMSPKLRTKGAVSFSSGSLGMLDAGLFRTLKICVFTGMSVPVSFISGAYLQTNSVLPNCPFFHNVFLISMNINNCFCRFFCMKKQFAR